MTTTEGLLAHIKERVAAELIRQRHQTGRPGFDAVEVLNVIDEAAAEFDTDTSPEPFAVGRRVEHPLDRGVFGHVTRRVVSDEGELHTVWVSWPNGSAIPYSPRQLVEVPE